MSLYHTPAAFALCDKPLTLQVMHPDEERELLQLYLEYTLTAEGSSKSGKLRMLPVDGVTAAESYSVYAATLPAALLQGCEALQYCFDEEGVRSDGYCIPLLPSAPWPPFVMTEYFPWAGGPVQCMELFNPGEREIDLYDYELIIAAEDGTVQNRNPLADAKGVNVLPAGELGVLNFLSPAVHKELDARAGVADAVFSYLSEAYPETCSDIAERGVRWMQVELSHKNEKGEWKIDEGCFPLYHWINERRCCVVPRGGDASEAVYTLHVNPDRAHLQVRKFRASLWTVDPCDPKTAVCIRPRVMPTPGFAAECQALPLQAATTVPAILPVEPSSRVHLAKGDCRITFAVAAPDEVVPTVYVKDKEGFTPITATWNADGLFEATVPYAMLSRMTGKLYYYITARGGLYTATCGTAERPLMQRISDDAGPEILRALPADGQVLEKVTEPVIELEYYDVSGVNLHTSILCLDGHNVSAAAEWTAERVTYRPERALAMGEHTVEVSLRDTLGNRTYRKITFGICDGTEMNCYRGEVHCHTLDSDGMGSPEEAMTYARDVGKVDYFAVTDHSHYLTLEELREQRRMAETFNKGGSYATMHGFEMTWWHVCGFWGHLNVLNTDWIEPYYESTDLYSFYDRLVADKDAIGMFNHPIDAWGDFDEFGGYTPERDEKMCLAEIRGGSFDRGYTLMLSKGWHAAPVANEDNHSANWTTATTSTGYVLAPALTRENVLEAFRLRRTYTTSDNTMRILYRMNGEWMGTRLQGPDKLLADIEIHTESESGIGLLSLVTEDNIVVARIDAGPLRDFTWQVELDPDFDYYYLRVNNGTLYSVTSPVYVEGRNLLNITGMHYGVCHEEKRTPHVVEATVQNASDKTMRDVTVDFYLSPLSGFELRARTPFASEHIDKLEPGETHTFSRLFSTSPGNRRVSAVVSGFLGKERYADTAYRMISPVLIGKQMPLTSSVTVEGEEIKNPFSYVELYNPMPHEVVLEGYSLRLWHATGANPLPERSLELKGHTIPAGGTLTIWVRPANAPLTVEDFNTRYGTSLVENVDLIVTANRITSGSDLARRLELLYKKEIVARVTYGRFCAVESDVMEDVPLLYGDFVPMSMRQQRIADGAALPGALDERQIPVAKRVIRRREEPKEGEKHPKRSIVTRLTKAPLVPLQAARLVASAVSALKVFFSKE